MKQINTIFLLSFILCSSCGLSGLPKIAEAANIVCDSLEQYEHFRSQILSVKSLISEGQYDDALIVAKDLYNQYRDFKDTEGLKELKSLVSMLESLV